MPSLNLPSARDISLAPERQSLAMLQAALLVAEQALLAEHPTALRHDEPRIFDPPTLALARELLACSSELRHVLDRYQKAVEHAAALVHFHQDDIPF
jgi:hypothetical protein